MSTNPRYPVILRPLNADDGGGWIALVPDLPGCMSDGQTGDEAFRNVLGAIDAWEDMMREEGGELPDPDSFLASAQFAVPAHLRPQIDQLAKEVEAAQGDTVPREQIMAGIMLQMFKGHFPEVRRH